MKTEVTCAFCGNTFLKTNSEINRTFKRGLRHFCSQSCSGKASAVEYNNLGEELGKCKSHKIIDEYSPFKYLYKSILGGAKRRGIIFDITLADLKCLWDKQQGVCPYTGWKLTIGSSTTNSKRLPKTPDRASVDRIENEKGYTKDNIEFVSMIVQFAKNEWSGQQVVEFCEAVVSNKLTGKTLL